MNIENQLRRIVRLAEERNARIRELEHTVAALRQERDKLRTELQEIRQMVIDYEQECG